MLRCKTKRFSPYGDNTKKPDDAYRSMTKFSHIPKLPNTHLNKIYLYWDALPGNVWFKKSTCIQLIRSYANIWIKIYKKEAIRLGIIPLFMSYSGGFPLKLRFCDDLCMIACFHEHFALELLLLDNQWYGWKDYADSN